MFEEEFQLVKIETHVLKVPIHCDGCARKVKKLLKKIEGVYVVSIDTELQKVRVSGTVDCATVMRKLIKSGKHAELWPPTDKQNQNLQGLPSWLLDDQYGNLLQGHTNGANYDWNRERYLNQNAGMKSLTGEPYNFGATTMRNDRQFGWNEGIVPDARNLEDAISYLAFPDATNSDYPGFKRRGYPEIQHLQSSPVAAHEHYYDPFLRSNNMQQHKCNPPSNTMMHLQNLPASLAYEHYSPPFVTRNNMQPYQYNLPSPMQVNPDVHAGNNLSIFDNNYMHKLPQGVVNPIFSPAINNSWNYY